MICCVPCPVPVVLAEVSFRHTWLGATPSGLEALEAICLAKKSSFAAADASNWLRVYSDLAPPKAPADSFSCTMAQCGQSGVQCRNAVSARQRQSITDTTAIAPAPRTLCGWA